MPKIHCAASCLIALALVGCATPTVVQEKQSGDSSLNCSQLTAAIDEARDFETKARGDRRVTGTNVAAALLFWPALIVTYSNTEDAINAARERQAQLLKLFEAKKCGTEATAPASTSQLEQKLLEIKSLFDRGLLSESEYEAARKKVLGL